MLGDFFRNHAEIVINSERAFLCTLLVCCGCFLLFRANILFKWTPRARSFERGQQSEAKETVESSPPQDQSAVEEIQDLSEKKSQTSIHPPRAGYPIQILHEDNDATVDIVAVHGLGANPDYAWTWLPKNNPPGEPGYPTSHLNWLQDLLPTCLSANSISSRIMTFNYHSRWILNAPRQRLSNISDVMLDSLIEKRASNPHRPLIFIGHSFGGNLIEQAIVFSSLDKLNRKDIAQSTVGVVFLGTPHRGSSFAAWGRLIASLAPHYLLAERRTLAFLEEQSDILTDCLQNFSRWLLTESVPVVCCFEQLVTSYSKRLGALGNLVPSFQELVVPETSACIDGHHKISLYTDHFKINKFYGLDDPSFKLVYPEIRRMAQNAEKTLACRRKPRTLPTDEASTSGRLRKCLRAMRVPNPRGILFEIQTQKEKRLESTCEWILKENRFCSWAAADKSRLLRLVGPPGIGKTMIATYLAETIEQKVEKASGKMFAYFFFDNKGEEGRRTPTAMLRSLIWQLLLQNESLFRHVQPEFEQHEKQHLFQDLFERFSTMWLIFQDMIRDEQAGEVFILIDALDECDEATRKSLLTGIHNLFDSSSQESGRFKFLLTHRPEISDIEGELSSSGTSFRVDSINVDKDLKSYVNFKTDELANLKKIPKDLTEKIRNTLTTDCDGTFLWVSLMTAELGRGNVLMHQFEQKLKHLPSRLDEIYVSILDQIPRELQHVAQFILHSMVAARRPFTKIEIMTAFAASHLAGSNSPVPIKDDIQVYQDIFSTCSSIIMVDKGQNGGSEILRFCHQSVKDFLLSATSQAEQQWFNTTSDHANLVVFQACWKYLSAGESKLANVIIHQSSSDDGIYQSEPKNFKSQTSTYSFLRYGTDWWQWHAISSYPAVLRELKIDVTQTPPLRDIWALREAREGQPSVLRFLIENGVDVKRSDEEGNSLFSLAASHGNVAVVKLLLSTNRVDVDSKNKVGQTPLALSATKGHASIVKLLLATKKVEIDSKDLEGWSPFAYAAFGGHLATVEILLATEKVDVGIKDQAGRSILPYAALGGHIDVIKRLILTGKFDINSKDSDGGAILSYAILGRRVGLFKILLAMEKIDVNSECFLGRPLLSLALEESQVAMAALLLATGNVDVDSTDQNGWTPLLYAAKRGHPAIVKLLLATGKVDVNSKDPSGSTALSYAAYDGMDNIVEMLLATGKADLTVENCFNHTPFTLAVITSTPDTIKLLLAAGARYVDSKTRLGRTPLSYAAQAGNSSVLRFLLSCGASDTPDSIGRNPFMFAASGGWLSIVLIYLARRPSAVNNTDHYGSNALSLAIRHRRTAVVQLLLDTGRFALDSEDCFGRSLLWWARSSRSTEIEALLLNAAKKRRLSLLVSDDRAIETYVESVSRSNFDKKCDVCTLALCFESKGYHVCRICMDGKFSICHYCYNLGARCLEDEHQLLWMDSEALQYQWKNSCRNGPGDDWPIVGPAPWQSDLDKVIADYC